ncbi:MAG: hypothetical protein D6782_11950, partial [Alphaproteobacteria bacterium]
LEGAVWGGLGAGIVIRLAEMYLLKRLIGLPIGATVRACHRSLVSLGVMAVVVLSLGGILPTADDEGSALLRLAVQSAAGAVVYVAVHVGLWHFAGRPLGIESRLIGLVQRKWLAKRRKAGHSGQPV